MLIVVPLECHECKKIIPTGISYEEGLVQMDCNVKGFSPFKFETFLSWCSQECFLVWYNKNFKKQSQLDE